MPGRLRSVRRTSGKCSSAVARASSALWAPRAWKPWRESHRSMSRTMVGSSSTTRTLRVRPAEPVPTPEWGSVQVCGSFIQGRMDEMRQRNHPEVGRRRYYGDVVERFADVLHLHGAGEV